MTVLKFREYQEFHDNWDPCHNSQTERHPGTVSSQLPAGTSGWRHLANYVTVNTNSNHTNAERQGQR